MSSMRRPTGKKFQAAHAMNWSRIDARLAQLRDTFPNQSDLGTVGQGILRIERLAADLEKNLAREEIDWDEARATLVQVTEHATRTNEAVDRLMQHLNKTSRSEATSPAPRWTAS